ncbi:MAG: glycosyltransferase family 39 protein, partial [Nanoarchaeota archaeon]|nr:glycosyltransferase family 39 protein [Nanoarchaeota archaeon]
MLSKKSVFFIILMILIFGLIFRLNGLTSESAWLDETLSVYKARYFSDIVNNFPAWHCPFYLLLAGIFVKTFGPSIVALRILSLFFGISSIIMIYILGKELFNRRIGVITSLFLAFSSYHIFYSQEARMYSLLFFLSLISMYFFIKYFNNNNKNCLKFFCITTVLSLYTHLFSILTLVAQNIFFILSNFFKKNFQRLKEWIVFQFVIVMVSIPALVSIFLNVDFVNLEVWRRGFVEFSFLEINFSGGWWTSMLFRYLLVYGLIFLVLKWKHISIKDKNSLSLMVLWIIIPILFSIIYTYFIGNLFIARYVIYLSIGYYFLVAFSIDKLHKYLKVPVIILFLVLTSIYLLDFQEQPHRGDWKGVSQYIQSIQEGYEHIIIEPGFALIPFSYYHDKDCFLSTNIYDCATSNKIYTVWNNTEQEKKYTNQARKIIYI